MNCCCSLVGTKACETCCQGNGNSYCVIVIDKKRYKLIGDELFKVDKVNYSGRSTDGTVS